MKRSITQNTTDFNLVEKYIGSAYDQIFKLSTNLDDVLFTGRAFEVLVETLYYKFIAVADQTTVTGLDENGRTMTVLGLTSIVYKNLVRMSEDDYVVNVGGTIITFDTALAAGDEILVAAFGYNVDGTLFYDELLSQESMATLVQDIVDAQAQLDANISAIDDDVIAAAASAAAALVSELAAAGSASAAAASALSVDVASLMPKVGGIFTGDVTMDADLLIGGAAFDWKTFGDIGTNHLVLQYNNVSIAHLQFDGGLDLATSVVLRAAADVRYAQLSGATFTGNITMSGSARIAALAGTGIAVATSGLSIGSNHGFWSVSANELRLGMADGTLAYTFANTGTTAGAVTTVMSRQMSDTRYPQLAAANVFTANQTIRTTAPWIILEETDAPANKKIFRPVVDTGAFGIDLLTDAGAFQERALEVSRETDGTFADATLPSAGSATPGAKSLLTKERADALYSSGAMVFLTTADAISDATLDFTAFDAGQYDAYQLVLSHVVPVTDNATLQLLLSSDGGVNYDNTAGQYASGLQVLTHASTTTTTSLTPVGASTTTHIQLTTAVDNAGGGVSGTITLLSPHTVQKTHVTTALAMSSANTSTVSSIFGGGGRLSLEAMNAARLRFSAGNISSGTITLYGIRNS